MELFLLSLTICTVDNGLTDARSSNKCPCDYNQNTHMANCFLRGLDKVPDCVPNTTLHMDLRVNRLVYHPRQFERFTSLRSLDLTGNPILDLGNDLFAGLSDLRELTLSDCGLTNLEGSNFNGLLKLRKLSLNLNAINGLAKDSFNVISNLTYLDLSYNAITSLEELVFSKLSRLEYLDLSHNPSYVNNSLPHTRSVIFSSQSLTGLSSLGHLILRNITLQNSTSFPVDIFRPLHNLTKLNLILFCRTYEETDYNCPNLHEHLGQVPTLQKLYLDADRINQLGPGFASLSNLQEIKFTTAVDGIRLGDLGNETFKNLKDTKVSKLVLDAWHPVQIDNIEPLTFSVIKTLQVLDFSFSSEMCNDAFNNIFIGLETTSIKSLRLSIQCPSQVFLRTESLTSLAGTQLEKLDLSYSSLSRLWGGDFFFMLPKTLKQISLFHNAIDRINLTYLHTLEQLVSLDLSHQTQDIKRNKRSAGSRSPSHVAMNSINNTQTGAIADTLTSILGRGNGHNSVGTVECHLLPFHLQMIDISYSSLFPDIVKSLCSTNNSLTRLDVSNQRWHSSISSNKEMSKFWKPLKTLDKLEYLNLNGDRIRYIPDDAFSKQSQLKQLHVTGNMLNNISFNVDSLRQIELIDLTDNNIHFATDQFMKQIEAIPNHSNITIHLERNSLACKCNSLVFVQWLRDTTIISNKAELKCKYTNGSQISLTRVSDIYDTLQKECTRSQSPKVDHSAVIVGCILGLIIFLLLVIIVIMFRRYRRIRDRIPLDNMLLS